MMAQRPSPDKDLINQVLFDRRMNNLSNPIPDQESSLLADSPATLDKSVGRMNSSFSRTKIAASLPQSEKSIMDDAKKQLFANKEKEGVFLVSKHNNLLQQLSEQHHELKRLENKQQELIELKKQAEARLAAANETATQTIQAVSDEGTPRKMHSKYNTREIPYELEQVTEGNLVEYDPSDNDEEEKEEDELQDSEPLTLDSFQFDVLQKRLADLQGPDTTAADDDFQFDTLQKKLADLNRRQKELEQKSLENQNIANNSFRQFNGPAEQRDEQYKDDEEEEEEDEEEEEEEEEEEYEEGEEEEGGYEETGHANTTDYDQLCAKVEELRERKKYMDQLLSYYNLLKDSNNESKELIDDNSVLEQSREKFGDPSERDQELLHLINTFQPQHPSPTSPLIEEINTPGVEASIGAAGAPQPIVPQEVLEKQEREEEIRRQKEGEEEKMTNIQAMRNQLSRIQQDMGSITFTETDSAEDISSKLLGLESTRNRVKELRERLALFEETDVEKPVPVSDEDKLQALFRAREKLQHLHELATKVKEARAGGHGIPENVLNEISMIVPKEQVSPKEETDVDKNVVNVEEDMVEEKEQDTTTEEKLSTLLRRKLELETVQNELKQLRDQQQLLSNMEQSQGIQGRRVIPECDREQLWESLREKQAAQLDRLKRSESKYEGDSNDGYTTRATWGGSSVRSLETADQVPEDDIEGGQYPERTFEFDGEEGEDMDTKEEESRDARLLYEIETNYWIEHCKQLSKQLAERTHTIHMLLGDKQSGAAPSADAVEGKADLYVKIEHLTAENDALHSELNEIYGMDAFQSGTTGNVKRRANDSEYSTPAAGKTRTSHDRSYADKTYSNYSAYSGFSTPYSPNPARNFRKPVTPSAYPQHYPAAPWHPHPEYYAPHYPPHHAPYYHHSPYHVPREFTPYSDYGYSPGAGAMYMYPPYPHAESEPSQYSPYDYGRRWPFFPSFYDQSFDETLPSDPNSPFVTRTELSGDKQADKQTDTQTDKQKLAENKNGKNVSFSLSQIKTSGDTISTQYPTPRKHEAYKKLAESGEAPADDVISVSSTESSESLQVVDQPSPETVTENKEPARTAFESLQNTVYSEVASLISANETRPHYLIELVKELSGLDNDYLRQRHLYMLRDLRGGFISTDKPTDGQTNKPSCNNSTSSWLKENNWSLFSASEATPSNNSVISDGDNEYEQDTSKLEDAEYDYLENAENVSSVSTTNSHPFASESLGSTAINLSNDLAEVRRREEMEKRLEDVVQDVIAKYGIRRSESSSAADNTSECDDTSEIESSFSILEQEVKRVMIQVIPLLRDNLSEVLTSQLQLTIAATIIRSTASVFDSDQISENFASNLTNAMKTYEGKMVQECAHSIIVDLSEVLFQDVHASHIIIDEDSDESDEEEEEEEDELVLENGPTPTPQDIRSRFLASTGVGYDESDDPELEYSDTARNEVECAVSNTQDEDDDDELRIVEEDEPVQPRFSETGELFSDGGDMSDIVELPATEDESNDDVPVKELSSDNILTVEDLPTKLSIPGVAMPRVPGVAMPSYRDAVVGTQKSGNLPTTSSPIPTTLIPARQPESPANQPENPVSQSTPVSEVENGAAANGPETPGDDLQAVLEVMGDSNLVGDGSAILPPP